MSLKVVLTADALSDLDEIHAYIAEHSGNAMADRIADGIRSQLLKVVAQADAGSYPPELLEWGIREFRQTRYKPYRIIYQADATRFIVMLIADGRRDMKTLLQRRLLA
ncbi:MAG: type II toxin-antitoxin system RelE/ParE family toxin [Stagnimonas sp.]|nr:type II toxin-antitoxin system RelE/ParE family toxin [Stagnimonas sp.]